MNIDLETITSIKNPLVVAARQLNRPAERINKCLLEGETIISWALEYSVTIENAFVTNSYNNEQILEKLLAARAKIFRCSDGIMKKITETKHLAPIVCIANLSKRPLNHNSQLMVMLDNLQDQGNIGTIIRTATAFGIKDIITSGKSADLFNKKTITASRGTTFKINHKNFDNPVTAITELQNKGFQVIATSPRGQQLQALTKLKNKPAVLIVGNETTGSSNDVLNLADLTIQIPMASTVESLNVGVAAGISMYELKLKVIMAMLTKNIRATLGRELGVAHKLIQQTLDLELKKICNHSSKQIILLMIMLCDVEMTRKQAEKDTSSHGKELDDILEPLLTDGLMVLNTNTNCYSVTPYGEKILAKLWNVIEQSETKILAGFSEDEQSQLKNFIKRIQKNCATLLEN